MRTRDRFLRGLEVGQQTPLLRDIEDVAEADRRVARKRSRSFVHRLIPARLAQCRQRFLHRGRRTTGGHLHRYRCDAKAARSELLVLESERGQVRAMIGGRRYQRRLDVHRLRHQQRLACSDARFQALQQAVVQDPLVGGMLIDQHESLRSLGNKIAGADLGVLGADFKVFDGTIKVNVLAQAEALVGQDFLKLNGDMTNTGQTFATLGDDFIKLSNGPNQELDAAYKLLGGELHKIGSAFDAVASDFLKLSQDFEILAGGRNTALVASSPNSRPGPLGTDFLKLDQDFLLLNQAIGGAFPGTAKAIDALLDQSGKPHGDEMHDTPPLLGVNHGSGH